GVVCPRLGCLVTPALLIRISIAPSADAAFANADPTAVASLMSTTAACARMPRLRRCSAKEPTASLLSNAAIAAPSPPKYVHNSRPMRSEERRVGKEGGCRGWRCQEKKKLG